MSNNNTNNNYLFQNLLMVYRVLFVALLMFAMTGCTSMMFFPLKKHLVEPKEFGVNYSDVYFSTTDELTLHGWLLPATTEKKGTVIFFHGNAQNISTHTAAVYWLPAHGYDVFAVDYRGYGKSEGESELKGIIEDVGISIKYAVDNFKGEQPFIVMGQSLGASLTVYPVANSTVKAQISGLILVSGFSDFRKISRDVLARGWLTWLFQWPLSWTINNTYSPVQHIALLDPLPIAFLASRDDEVIPFEHTLELQQAYPNHSTLIELSGGHNDMFHDENNRELLLKAIDKITSHETH